MSSSPRGEPQAASQETRCFNDVPCLGCGCLCDDIQVTLQRNSLQEATGACTMGTDWFARKLHDPSTVSCRVEGEPATLDDAIAAAGKILGGATYPLVFGLTSAANQTISTAVELADRLGAVVDLSLDPLERAYVLAKQKVGDRAATLGFVKNHATLTVFFGCDPVTTHPRHLERYSSGERIRLVTVDSRPSATSAQADHHFQISPGSALPAVLALRSLAQNKPIDEPKIESSTGLSLNTWRQLHELIRQAELTAVFFGDSGLDEHQGELGVFCESMLRWGAEMSVRSRIVTLPLGGLPNSTGALDTLTWQTGYPFAVDFSAGFPQFDPLRFSAETLLTQQSVDAVLVVDSAEHVYFSALSQSAIDRAPTIVLSPQPYSFLSEPNVWIPTTAAGVGAKGTIHRIDHVALPARQLLNTKSPHATSVLQRLMSVAGR